MRAFDCLSDAPATCVALPIASVVNLPELAMNSHYGLVVDVANTEPENGAYSIARFNSLDPKLYLVEPAFIDCDGDTRCRLIIPCRTIAGHPVADGPYDLEGDNAWYLRSKIVGCVIGYVSIGAGAQNGKTDLAPAVAPLLRSKAELSA